MTEQRVTELTPEQEAPIIHRHLSSLPRLEPSAGFGELVMARVWQPAPAWIRRAAVVGRTVFNRETKWIWFGGLAASSVFSMVAFAAGISANWSHIQSAWSAFAGTVLLDAWRATLRAMAAATQNLNSAMDPWLGNSTALTVFSVGASVILALSTWGFLRTIRQYNQERLELDAGIS